jgi:hypothetical protein
MATRKTAKKVAAPAAAPANKPARAKRARWKTTKVLNKRGFFRPDSLAGYMATVTVGEIPYLDSGRKEAEACISLRYGSDTIDLSFFATDKKEASKELAQLDALVKLVSATRDAYLKALNKAFG